MNVFFDVQGTLISEGGVRPHVREVFHRLVEAGHNVYVWSAGGAPYAAAAAERLGISDLVSGCCDKSFPPVEVDFTVDDSPIVEGEVGYFTIPPYRGDPDDDALYLALDEILSHA
ncbi:MAG: hypothetical protein K6T51_08180 [Rubrobacteraceae bacterium]|uniref:hypothetical protein n=1 Tax=Rubrobacter naiadicus TaxID=1392641 RepID=UPI00235F8285|nr:hypothetical protein [Rubrobacter naiadicus]MBX6763460.1 hypothetical protein [Rubrobacteraceae bacterium]MCL6438576.1 hypothetical protein [Rubrobacteraceae bacterium]